MIPAAFEYESPRTLDEALRLVERHGDEAKVLAGGHSLLPLMKLRLASPRYVIDIGRVKGLDAIREEGDRIAIGALVTHAAVAGSKLLQDKCPLMPETAMAIGDVQVRNRGTIGGSLAHADPAADYPATILALDAEMVAASSSGKRTIKAREFFVDMLTTALRPGEILTEIRVPVFAARTGASYQKLHQPASGFALVGAAARVVLGANGQIDDVALGVTGLGSKGYRAEAVEKSLRGKKADANTLAAAAAHTAEDVDALNDIHASAEYRKEMAAVYARRALEAAVKNAGGKGKKA